MCIWKKNSHLKSSYSASWSIIVVIIFLYYFICSVLQIQIYGHIGLNHPFIVGYGANILCHSQHEQMNCQKKNLIER